MIIYINNKRFICKLISCSLDNLAAKPQELAPTTVVFIEVPTNPDMKVPDMGALAEILKAYKEKTGKKVSYVGVSQGTVQMFYALAKLEEDFFADNLFTFAALDPCTIQVDEG